MTTFQHLPSIAKIPILFGGSLLMVAASVTFADWEPEVLFDRSGRTDSAAYGEWIIPLGDQNDDGFDDWAIAADYYYDIALYRLGYVEIFLGGDPVPQQPYLAFGRPYSYMVNIGGLESLGDINGDGYRDFSSGGGYITILVLGSAVALSS